MTVEAHIHALESKRVKLNDNIHEAYTRHLADETVFELKKERLRIEDEIESLKHG